MVRLFTAENLLLLNPRLSELLIVTVTIVIANLSAFVKSVVAKSIEHLHLNCWWEYICLPFLERPVLVTQHHVGGVTGCVVRRRACGTRSPWQQSAESALSLCHPWKISNHSSPGPALTHICTLLCKQFLSHVRNAVHMPAPRSFTSNGKTVTGEGSWRETDSLAANHTHPNCSQIYLVRACDSLLFSTLFHASFSLPVSVSLWSKSNTL